MTFIPIENLGGSNVLASIVYGFKIDSTISNPNSNITYLEDAIGKTPAYMNYSNGEFNYGDWKNAFFMPKPCMLKSNGEVAYYLNPNNYALKEDGSASDISNTSFDGNAMMEWGRGGKQIWTKIVADSTGFGASVYISNAKKDDDYKAWSFVGRDGTLKKHFYTPIYNGSNVSNKLRSLSGQTCASSLSGTTEITYAQANGVGWHTEIIADRILINLLLMLIGKSTNTQATFGNGHYINGSSASSLLKTGTMDNKGLFWGTNGSGSGVKIFGMENWWGNMWRRTSGLVNANGTQKYKLTYGMEDGSSIIGWNTDGSGYKTVGNSTPSGTSGGYLNRMLWTKDGMFGKNASGSETTYYCDGMGFNNSQNSYALVGGACNNSWSCGAFALNLGNLVSYAVWAIGATISYHA